MRPYDEIIDFMAAGYSPADIIAFRPSSEAQERVSQLLGKEKTVGLTEEESEELAHYLQIEHLMCLAKAKARLYLSNG